MKVGLLIFTANDRNDFSKRSYDSIRAITQRAEADGFDSIWLADHLLYHSPGEPIRGIWESWTVLSALAEATKHVEIGTPVTCNSFRNPAILAKMATAVDEVSHGRLILGIGAGWNEPEYQAFGLPFDHRVGRFEEALQIIRPLLHDGHVDFRGRYYQAMDCDDLPRGPRPHGPPLMVGGEGQRIQKLAARYADMWNTGYMGKPETALERLYRVHEACRKVGRNPATLGTSAFICLWFPESQPKKPGFAENMLNGTAEEIAQAIRGYEELGVQHVMFQCEPYTPETLRQLTEALRLDRGG